MNMYVCHMLFFRGIYLMIGSADFDWNWFADFKEYERYGIVLGIRRIC